MGLAKFRNVINKDNDYTNIDVIINNIKRKPVKYKSKIYNIDTLEINLFDEEFIASRILWRD